MPHDTVNPATGKVDYSLELMDAAAVEQRLAAAAQAFPAWAATPLERRGALLQKVGAQLRARREEIQRLMTAEMGKLRKEALAEIDKCADACDYYAEHAADYLRDVQVATDAQRSYVRYEPLGCVLAVMPWNFPIWQVLRGAVPTLIAGNTYVLKHAPNVMGSAYLLRDAFVRAGFPDGVFEVINVTPEGVSSAIADSRIAAVTLTGSVRAGMAIGAQAGAALKKCVLELGGSDPFIVLNDADLDEAVHAAVVGRYQNSGQVCAAAKRLIIEQGVVEEFTRKFVEATRQLKMGDPLNADTYIGPMARFDLRDELDQQVRDTLEEGATLLLGGRKAEGTGNFYEPTVLADVTDRMTSFKQELFGPVASIITARDCAHAVALANDSDFGLTATIYTANVALAEQLTSELETGGVFINGYSASDPRVTFGGVKKSGFGRELSHFGVREFCNAQTVWLDRK